MAFGSPTQSQVRQGYRSPETIDTRQSKLVLEGNGTAIAEHLPPSHSYNPPADPRAWALGNPGFGKDATKGKLLRGRISMWDVEVKDIPRSSRKSRSLNFLYNPNTITHSYEFSPENIPPMGRTGQDVKTPVLMSGQSVAWKLYFNRQYDVASATGPTDIRQHGVLSDTQALERIMGVYKPGEGVAAQVVVVVFGSTIGGVPFGYTGWLTSVNVQFLMFSHRMVPTVAEVDIQMAHRMIPETVSGSATPTTARSTPATSNFAWESSGGVTGNPATGGVAVGATTASDAFNIDQAQRAAAEAAAAAAGGGL